MRLHRTPKEASHEIPDGRVSVAGCYRQYFPLAIAFYSHSIISQRLKSLTQWEFREAHLQKSVSEYDNKAALSR